MAASKRGQNLCGSKKTNAIVRQEYETITQALNRSAAGVVVIINHWSWGNAAVYDHLSHARI
ncbi:hypothetical protein TUM17561_33600 [Enterobacter cloacae]|jgi:hypothetical protein|nr:hypothetical protein TUM17561_33600 [Enterobacter cloacae]